MARALLCSGWQVRAFVRDADSKNAHALKLAGASLAIGDFAHEASLREAMRGADGVYSVQPSSGQGALYGLSDDDEIRYGIAVANIAQEAGVKHFVYSSAQVAAGEETGIGHFDSKMTIERHVQSLAMPYTIIRPNTFMEILALPGMGLAEGTVSFLTRPDQCAQFIAVDDIGSIVAKIVDDPARYAGRIIEIAGDAATGDDIAAKFGHVLGKNIVYSRFSDSLLASSAFLTNIVAMADKGRLTGAVDLPAMRREFGPLLTFDDWLEGSGRDAVLAAAQPAQGNMALR